MRIERLGEKALILRELPCPAFELARWLNQSILLSGNGTTVPVPPKENRRSGSEIESHASVQHQRVRSFDSYETVDQTTNSVWLAQDDAAFFEEAVASYETVGLYFSGPVANPDGVLATVSTVIASLRASGSPKPKLIEVPVCYEFGPDLKAAAQALQMPAEELIDLHLQTDYLCYAVGFSPGFAYLGYLDDRIATLPRLSSPRPRVQPGSVGITGRQTAVYPSTTPGGWNLIGRCPLTLVDVEDGYFPIEAGDQVRFIRIDDQEFGKQDGDRL